MTAADHANTGKQPVIVWKCSKCGRVGREEWVGGSHVREGASDQKQRCAGQPHRGYWITDDEYLDWLLEERP